MFRSPSGLSQRLSRKTRRQAAQTAHGVMTQVPDIAHGVTGQPPDAVHGVIEQPPEVKREATENYMREIVQKILPPFWEENQLLLLPQKH